MEAVDMAALMESAPQNMNIQNTFFRMDLMLDRYQNPVCSISGGSDSDTMLDIIERVRGKRAMTYVFFDTGIEYEATKRHLSALEQRYGIEILRRKAAAPVPLGCKEHGVPLISKQVSGFIERLQKHGFQWEDAPYEILADRYPGCRSTLKWWCNENRDWFNISSIRYLKEFMMENPPAFRISGACCKGAKKEPSGKFEQEIGAGLKILGLRKAEGGIRAAALASCFTPPKDDEIANYRPLWLWSDEDKAEYKAHYGLTYSDCYEVWGFRRTGCAGCPFDSQFEAALQIMREYEPSMALAADKIFGESYAYTRAYRTYRDRRKARDKTEMKGQMGWDEYMDRQA